MNKNTLDILANSISDVGSWSWWNVDDGMIQLEFWDVQLYDETKPEKDSHTTNILALVFTDNSFAVFLDNFDDEA